MIISDVQARIAAANTALTAAGMWALQLPGMGLLSMFVFLCSFIPIAGCFISTVPIGFVALTEYGFLKVCPQPPDITMLSSKGWTTLHCTAWPSYWSSQFGSSVQPEDDTSKGVFWCIKDRPQSHMWGSDCAAGRYRKGHGCAGEIRDPFVSTRCCCSWHLWWQWWWASILWKRTC